MGTLRSLEVSGRQLRLCTRLHVARNGGRGLYREESRRVCRVDFGSQNPLGHGCLEALSESVSVRLGS